MTAITIDDICPASPIFQLVQGQVAADDLDIAQATNYAAMDFCEVSGVLIDEANEIQVGKDSPQAFDLEFATDRFAVVRIVNMRYTDSKETAAYCKDYLLKGVGVEPGLIPSRINDEGDPLYYLVDNRGSFQIYPKPIDDGLLYSIQVAVKPKPIDFTMHNYNVLLPKYLIDNHSDIIALKAISVILNKRGNEFYEPQLARAMDREYRNKVNYIKTKRDINYNGGPSRFGQAVAGSYGFYRRR